MYEFSSLLYEVTSHIGFTYVHAGAVSDGATSTTLTDGTQTKSGT